LTHTRAMLETGLSYPRAVAEISATVLVEADARGHASHGVARIGMYYNWIKNGLSIPNAEPEIIYETPISLVVKGNKAPGFAVSDFAMGKTIEKALKNGTCMTVVQDSSHFGMAGLWAEKAADAGLIGVALTNTLKAGIPLFGKERLLGTNPICVAIPMADEPHFMLDMSTTTVALGKIETAARRDGFIPVGWAVDEQGIDTTDAKSVAEINRNDKSPYSGLLYLGGAEETLGGHKGYGLGLLVELLTAGLSLGKASYETYTNGCGICHYFQATRINLFGDDYNIRKHMGELVKRLRISSKAEGRTYISQHFSPFF